MTTIVLAVDGSEDARVASTWTAGLAERLGADVVAVHAVGLLEHERGDPGNRHLDARLLEWTCELDALPADRVRRQLIPGPPVSAILRAARDEHADLVVVGTRGVGARTGALLGSSSLQLAEQCPCPLVIVPRGSS